MMINIVKKYMTLILTIFVVLYFFSCSDSTTTNIPSDENTVKSISISPLFGLPDDTAIVECSGFSIDSDSISVAFGVTPAEIISIDGKKILVRVPPKVYGFNKIKVINTGEEFWTDSLFEVLNIRDYTKSIITSVIDLNCAGANILTQEDGSGKEQEISKENITEDNFSFENRFINTDISFVKFFGDSVYIYDTQIGANKIKSTVLYKFDEKTRTFNSFYHYDLFSDYINDTSFVQQRIIQTGKLKYHADENKNIIANLSSGIFSINEYIQHYTVKSYKSGKINYYRKINLISGANQPNAKFIIMLKRK